MAYKDKAKQKAAEKRYQKRYHELNKEKIAKKRKDKDKAYREKQPLHTCTNCGELTRNPTFCSRRCGLEQGTINNFSKLTGLPADYIKDRLIKMVEEYHEGKR